MTVSTGSRLVTSPGVARIMLDTPSQGPALGFDRTARALAQIIIESEPHFAIGIFGGWGSGKTTLMRAIQRQLPVDSVVATEFNAWRFEREPYLLVPLIDTVRGALDKWSVGRDIHTRRRVRRATRRIAHVVRGLAAGLSGEVGIPGAVKIGYEVDKAMDALSVGRGPSHPQSLYLAAFEELSKAIYEFANGGGATPIVVFIDDLDRCLPSNALEVLESIKLFFDFQGLVFVAGLDEGIVQRAVRARFSETGNSKDMPGEGNAEVNVNHAPAPARSLEYEYVEKIFQVPYRLPPVVPEQLDELLESMYLEAGLPSAQLDDFRHRVAPHLSYAAVKRRVNPRDIKRFLNTYTLQMLVRDDLDRDIVLVLQMLAFRYEWRPLYDAIFTDPSRFVKALTRYRENDDRSALESLSPELSELPTDLCEYLRSNLAQPLQHTKSLDPYLSSLKSAGTGIASFGPEDGMITVMGDAPRGSYWQCPHCGRVEWSPAGRRLRCSGTPENRHPATTVERLLGEGHGPTDHFHYFS